MSPHVAAGLPGASHCPAASGMRRLTPVSYLDAARDLLARSPVVDGHNDLAWELREAGAQDLDRTDLRSRLDFTHTDFPRLAEGGVGAQFWRSEERRVGKEC